MVRIFLNSRLGDIYLLICNISGKKYIGGSVDMGKRITKHECKGNDCESKIIINAGNYKLYGDLCINYKGVYENEKERYQLNKKNILECVKEYKQKNKKAIAVQKKDYYQKNKKVLNEKRQERQKNKIIKSWLDDLISQIPE